MRDLNKFRFFSIAIWNQTGPTSAVTSSSEADGQHREDVRHLRRGRGTRNGDFTLAAPCDAAHARRCEDDRRRERLLHHPGRRARHREVAENLRAELELPEIVFVRLLGDLAVRSAVDIVEYRWRKLRPGERAHVRDVGDRSHRSSSLPATPSRDRSAQAYKHRRVAAAVASFRIAPAVRYRFAFANNAATTSFGRFNSHDRLARISVCASIRIKLTAPHRRGLIRLSIQSIRKIRRARAYSEAFVWAALAESRRAFM